MFDTYGRKCNSRFFVNYGFCLDENKADNEAVMKFKMDEKCPLYSEKLQQLKRSSPLFEHQVPASLKRLNVLQMLRYLRFIFADESDLNRLFSQSEHQFNPLSKRCEKGVLLAIRQAADEGLAQFETSLDDDNGILETLEMFSNHRNAVIMRRGEKQVLHWWKGLTEYSLPWLDLNPIAFRRKLKELINTTTRTDGYDTYIIDVLSQIC